MRWRAWVVVMALVGMIGGLPTSAHAATAPSCPSRTLVLSAMPSEIDPILEAAQLDRSQTVDVDGHRFYVGKIRGADVVLGLTHIGPINADRTLRAAFSHFACGSRPAFNGVVFSGVAGVKYIGDVSVPSRWTLDNGKTWSPVDRRMYTIAKQVAKSPSLRLEQDTPTGDPVCACIDPRLVKTVRLTHEPKVVVGGNGQTTDPFGGRALPCFPNGGDVFGCDPCREQAHSAGDVERFGPGIVPFADPNFFSGYFQSPPTTDTRWAAQDEETAAVAKAAAENHTPFIGFRAGSDGQGDPLGLPGFPFQFFYYRQLAADNAAAMTVAFLQARARRSA